MNEFSLTMSFSLLSTVGTFAGNIAAELSIKTKKNLSLILYVVTRVFSL